MDPHGTGEMRIAPAVKVFAANAVLYAVFLKTVQKRKQRVETSFISYQSGIIFLKRSAIIKEKFLMTDFYPQTVNIISSLYQNL